MNVRRASKFCQWGRMDSQRRVICRMSCGMMLRMASRLVMITLVNDITEQYYTGLPRETAPQKKVRTNRTEQEKSIFVPYNYLN